MAIFISHSRHDQGLVEVVKEGLGILGSQTQAVVYEDLPEQVRGQDAQRIRRLVADCRAVFLFHTPNAERSEFTKTWIQFEVGVAAANEKPLVVFLQEGHRPTMPIAYFTDVAMVNHERAEDLIRLQQVARLHSALQPGARRFLKGTGLAAGGSIFGPLGTIVGFVVGLAMPDGHPLSQARKTKCPVCDVQVRLWVRPGIGFQCPQCLTTHQSKEAPRAEDS